MTPKPKQVEVVVSAAIVGTAKICPYNGAEGMETSVIYEVPTYRVTVAGDAVPFKAIRFALRRDNRNPAPAERPCDTGLSHDRITRPQWVPGYSPHSFPGGGPRGAWRIIPKPTAHFLIHEGPFGNMAAGSLGCIEIAGMGEWRRFLTSISRQAGLPAPMSLGVAMALIGRTSKLKLQLQHAAYPKAKRIYPP